MLVSGAWHGAGYTFVLWGLLHGIYLTINHAWRLTGRRLWASRESDARFMRPAGFVLTFLSVVMAMVLFRSPTVHAAVEVFKGMLGFNGIELPRRIVEKLGALGLPQHLASSVDTAPNDFLITHLWVVVLLLIALTLANTIQIMARYEPVLGARERRANAGLLPGILNWKPTIPWAIAVSVLAAAATMRVSGPSEFLYWQF